MAVEGKLEAKLELKASAERHMESWKTEAGRLPEAVPHHIQGVELHDGEWGSHGAIKFRNFTCEGKKETFKARLEVEEGINTVPFIGLGGTLMEEFSAFKVILPYFPNPESGCTAKAVFEYEKINDEVSDPMRYTELLKTVFTDLDAYLVNNE